jgi:hypothetical protein
MISFLFLHFGKKKKHPEIPTTEVQKKMPRNFELLRHIAPSSFRTK